MTTPSTPTAYCFKCKTRREIQHAQQLTLKNGTHALQGPCTVCGTRLSRIVAKQA